MGGSGGSVSENRETHYLLGRVDRSGWCSNPMRYGVLLDNVGMNTLMTVGPSHDKTNIMTCVPIKDSDQPGHSPSLIRVFAVHMKKHRVLSYP